MDWEEIHQEIESAIFNGDKRALWNAKEKIDYLVSAVSTCRRAVVEKLIKLGEMPASRGRDKRTTKKEKG